MGNKELELAKEIESAVGCTSLLNMHERTAFIVACLKEYAAEQRQMCADAVVNEIGAWVHNSEKLYLICLNATGESNE